MAAPFAFAGPAWAEVRDKMGPPLNAFVLAWLTVGCAAPIVGLARRWLWLSLFAAALLALTAHVHLADRIAMDRGVDDTGTRGLAAAIREGCRSASQVPGWTLPAFAILAAAFAIVDRLRRR